ncbi:lipid A deacylase LpxR family protein [Persicobacter psychrovividus]|uniref:Lipid A deacylase LpxR family protein n=1 Tax=Persicobacter psychrovividus TaxID=387638 RepID=A0ABN6L813_9BACT|nr:hypothetical protein PEPS_16350 [Persicobacter psychrovividus]
MRIVYFLFLFFACIHHSSRCLAQERQTHDYRSFQTIFDNDFFFFTDMYYTNGVRFSYIDPLFRKSPLMYPLGLFAKHKEQMVTGIQFRQDMYTPNNTHLPDDKSFDRPYASTLTLSQFAYVFLPEQQWRIKTEFVMGLVGQHALGGLTQGLVHKITPSHPPLGWEQQIKNDFLINYFVEADKGLVVSDYFEWMASGKLAVGSWQDHVGLGSKIRFGKMNSWFERLSPETVKRRSVEVYSMTGAEVKLIGYDATMQGGLVVNYDESPHTFDRAKVERLVQVYFTELGLTYRNHQILGRLTMTSPEFHGGQWHRWGRIEYRVWF